MADARRPLASGHIDSRALYRAQKNAERQDSLLYILLGVVSANRKLLHKAVESCDPDATAATSTGGLPGEGDDGQRG